MGRTVVLDRIRGAIPAPVLEICEVLRARGHRGWIVGGCLRDLLLERSVSDWDIATTAKPQQVRKMFRRVVPTGLQHGTVTVVWKGDAYEVTTLRGEGAYSDGRRPDEVFFVDDIEEDLGRRDFTVNAIAYDPIADQLDDPYDGLADLRAEVIRAVGDPVERFAEDGLRILRGARFVATLDFALEAGTRAAFDGALDTFRKVSAERVQQEWMKTMKARRPSRAFEIMRETGILAITCPVLLEQVGCYPPDWREDLWSHSMRTLDLHEGPAIERIAALLHDLGKPRALATDPHEMPRDHAEIGAGLAEAWLRDYRFSNQERDMAVHLILHHAPEYRAEWTDGELRRYLREVGLDQLSAVLRLARANARAQPDAAAPHLAHLDALEARVASLGDDIPLRIKDLAIGGKDVMAHLGGRPGPIVGRVLEALLEKVLDDPTLNDRETLLGLVGEVVRTVSAEATPGKGEA